MAQIIDFDPQRRLRASQQGSGARQDGGSLCFSPAQRLICDVAFIGRRLAPIAFVLCGGMALAGAPVAMLVAGLAVFSILGAAVVVEAVHPIVAPGPLQLAIEGWLKRRRAAGTTCEGSS